MSSELKDVPDETQHLINGYIRDIKKSIDNIIPDEIMFVILTFYYLTEYFKDTKCSLTEQNTKITLKSGYHNNAYGNIQIDSINHNDSCHYWIFKMGTMKNSIKAIIGIAEVDVKKLTPIYMVTGRGYGYFGAGKFLIPREDQKDYDVVYGKPKFEAGDTVEMVLNLAAKRLSFHINDDNKTLVAIDNIKIGANIKYKMAVFLRRRRDWITLVKYYTHISPQ